MSRNGLNLLPIKSKMLEGRGAQSVNDQVAVTQPRIVLILLKFDIFSAWCLMGFVIEAENDRQDRRLK